jgi:YD repeat-containing protein
VVWIAAFVRYSGGDDRGFPTRTLSLDSAGRVTQSQVEGLHPIFYGYDGQGHLASIAHGPTPADPTTRTFTLGYDRLHRLTSITDPLPLPNVVQLLDFDGADRPRTQRLPGPLGPRDVLFTYDGNGNLTSLTPPGRPAHAFALTKVNLEREYDPPQAFPPLATKATTYGYDAERQLELVTRPDGQTIDPAYDAAGRLSTVTLPGTQGDLVYVYSATTGRLASIAGLLWGARRASGGGRVRAANMTTAGSRLNAAYPPQRDSAS